jgi:hypothetical protein
MRPVLLLSIGFCAWLSASPAFAQEHDHAHMNVRAWRADLQDAVYAFTIGGVRDLLERAGLDYGLGGDVTVYGAPESLTSAYSAHPVSFHVFFRVRPSAGTMGRMWNMRMGQVMSR